MPVILKDPIFIILAVHALLLLVVWIRALPSLKRATAGVDRKTWITLAGIVLVALLFRHSNYWTGPSSDGFVSGDSARMWVLHGSVAKSCALGTPAECAIPEQPLAPPGLPFLIAVLNLIFGTSGLSASIVSATAGTLTVMLAFFCFWLVTEDRRLSLLASGILAIIPIHLLYSQTGESRPAGLFFSALFLGGFLLFLRYRESSLLLAAALSLSFAIYIRQETYLLAVPFAGYLLYEEGRRFVRHESAAALGRIIRQYALPAGAFVLFQIPVLRWLLVDNPYANYPGRGVLGLNPAGVVPMIVAYGEQFFNKTIAGPAFHFIPGLSLFFAVGLIVFAFSRYRYRWAVYGFFGAYLLVYCLMNDGITVLGTGVMTGDYMRRSTMFALPYAMFAAYGVWWVAGCTSSLFPRGVRAITAVALTIAILFASVGAAVRARPVMAASVYDLSLFADARATRSGDPSLIYPGTNFWRAVDSIPNGCLVIGSSYLVVTSDYFYDNKRRTAVPDLVNDATASLFESELARASCIYYIGDYRCGTNMISRDDLQCRFFADRLTLGDAKEFDGIWVYKAELRQR